MVPHFSSLASSPDLPPDTSCPSVRSACSMGADLAIDSLRSLLLRIGAGRAEEDRERKQEGGGEEGGRAEEERERAKGRRERRGREGWRGEGESGGGCGRVPLDLRQEAGEGGRIDGEGHSGVLKVVEGGFVGGEGPLHDSRNDDCDIYVIKNN